MPRPFQYYFSSEDTIQIISAFQSDQAGACVGLIDDSAGIPKLLWSFQVIFKVSEDCDLGSRRRACFYHHRLQIFAVKPSGFISILRAATGAGKSRAKQSCCRLVLCLYY